MKKLFEFQTKWAKLRELGSASANAQLYYFVYRITCGGVNAIAIAHRHQHQITSLNFTQIEVRDRRREGEREADRERERKKMIKFRARDAMCAQWRYMWWNDNNSYHQTAIRSLARAHPIRVKLSWWMPPCASSECVDTHRHTTNLKYVRVH